MSKAKLGTFDNLMELASGPMRPIMARLRSIILETDPDAREVVRLGDRAATYGLGPRKMIDGYAYVMPHRAWVILGFFRGATLDDRQRLLEGTGKKMRHVKVRSVRDAERDGIRELIDGAIAERRAALDR
ncbi:MAG: DUF1801 domain-containing protein [Bryobacterales bacterium]|nr:DUF1801 domain-containing protein [Bryobacterales bacterium]